jgi:hypothetical protein
MITIPMNVSIKAGSIYGIHVYSSTTTGCYGLAYSDSSAYPAGNEYVSKDSGMTYSLEPCPQISRRLSVENAGHPIRCPAWHRKAPDPDASVLWTSAEEVKRVLIN